MIKKKPATARCPCGCVYDHMRPPDQPKDVYATQYFFPPQKHAALLFPSAPWKEGPRMALHYDREGNLLLTRFIFKDGTWVDA